MKIDQEARALRSWEEDLMLGILDWESPSAFAGIAV